MGERFKGLRKLPDRPVGEMLAETRARIALPPDADPAAPPAEMLALLDRAGQPIDLIRLFAHVLPRREATWWACLAGRDILPEGGRWPTLETAEAWVRKPGEPTREAVMKAVTEAGVDEETTYVANAALHALPNEFGQEMGAPGMTAMMVEAQVLKSLFAVEGQEALEARTALLIDRALDIARGGNGRVGDGDLGAAHAG